MKKFLIIQGELQGVAEAETITDLIFKYPEVQVYIIELDDQVIKQIKDDNYTKPGSYA